MKGRLSLYTQGTGSPEESFPVIEIVRKNAEFMSEYRAGRLSAYSCAGALSVLFERALRSSGPCAEGVASTLWANMRRIAREAGRHAARSVRVSCGALLRALRNPTRHLRVICGT